MGEVGEVGEGLETISPMCPNSSGDVQSIPEPGRQVLAPENMTTFVEEHCRAQETSPNSRELACCADTHLVHRKAAHQMQLSDQEGLQKFIMGLVNAHGRRVGNHQWVLRCKASEVEEDILSAVTEVWDAINPRRGCVHSLGSIKFNEFRAEVFSLIPSELDRKKVPSQNQFVVNPAIRARRASCS